MCSQISRIEKLRLLNQVIVSVVGSTKHPTKTSISRERIAIRKLLSYFLNGKISQEEIEMTREDIFPQGNNYCKEKAPQISP